MKSKIIPRGDRVLIQKLGEEHLVVGGILKSESTKKASVRGRIISVGELVEDYQVGDDVFYGTYAPFYMQVVLYDDLKHYEGAKRDRGDVLLLNCSDIVALVESDE